MQTLVENVVRPAASPREEGAEVTIRASVEGGRLGLVVADDGPGPGAAPSSNGTGRGLRLLGERLRTRFGEDAQLITGAGPDGGFQVQVLMPAGGAP